MVHNEEPGERVPTKWEMGKVTFHNPLVIQFNTKNDYAYDETNWKMILYEHYKKKGKALSQAIRKEGYDGIVTVAHNLYTKEIIDISMF